MTRPAPSRPEPAARRPRRPDRRRADAAAGRPAVAEAPLVEAPADDRRASGASAASAEEPTTNGRPGDVVLRLTDVVKTFPGVRALDGVQLEVRAGEVHCLLGQNGAGKSTLIKVLSGVHQPDAGPGRVAAASRSTSPTRRPP